MIFTEYKIISCVRCGANLRIPETDKTLAVTCPVCKNKFKYNGEKADGTGKAETARSVKINKKEKFGKTKRVGKRIWITIAGILAVILIIVGVSSLTDKPTDTDGEDTSIASYAESNNIVAPAMPSVSQDNIPNYKSDASVSIDDEKVKEACNAAVKRIKKDIYSDYGDIINDSDIKTELLYAISDSEFLIVERHSSEEYDYILEQSSCFRVMTFTYSEPIIIDQTNYFGYDADWNEKLLELKTIWELD